MADLRICFSFFSVPVVLTIDLLSLVAACSSSTFASDRAAKTFTCRVGARWVSDAGAVLHL